MTPPQDRLDTIEQLRVNADRLTAIAGPNWRLVTASDMGCLTFDVGIGPVEQRRDSDPIDVSNFRVIYHDLRAVDGRVTAGRFDLDDTGWFEQIVVPLDNPTLVDRITQWSHKLARDMVANPADLAALLGIWPHDDT